LNSAGHHRLHPATQDFAFFRAKRGAAMSKIVLNLLIVAFASHDLSHSF
jgi:hypothetical protein